jgi:hypothetical protein
MINLNDERFEEREFKIFNGGEAGVVKGCSVRVEKKTANDTENAPDYKLFVTDETGAEFNKGYFKGNLDDMSEGQEQFFVKEMKHLAKVFRVQDQLPTQVASYEELIDTTMKLCNKNQANVKVNVAVCYGTVDYPRRFLELDGFWGIQNVEDGVPRLSRKALTERPEPDSDGPDITIGGGSEDSGVADDWA